jgi:replicative DNA helicase
MKNQPRVTVNIGEMFNKQPPSSGQAERSLIGSVLLDPTVIDDVALIVTAEMFASQANRELWEAATTLYESTRAVDASLLLTALQSRGTLERIGGAAYLQEVAESCPSSAAAAFYAAQVAGSYRLRRLIESATTTIHEAYTGHDGTIESVRRIIDMAEQRIYGISDEGSKDSSASLASLIEAEINAGEEAEGIRTGYRDLDAMLGGLRDGELIILAARPSVGKTAFAMNIAEQIAMGGFTPDDYRAGKHPIPVGVFSMEMGRRAITQRLLSQHSGVPMGTIRAAKLSSHDADALSNSAKALGALTMIIDDTPGLSVTQLRSLARRMKSRHDVRVIVVDYLQLMSAPAAARESRQAEVSEISRGIKALARELGIPIVCLSQLNRQSESRTDNRPKMSDLRESGSIEQDADVVLLLHREDYHHRHDPAWAVENPERVGLAEVIVAKQRNGPCDVVRLTFDGPTMRFLTRDRSNTGDLDGGFMP